MRSVSREKRLNSAVASSAAPQRILAIDYGRKRIGLALSDQLGVIAQPLGVLVRKNRLADIKRLREICANQSVDRIIVGFPVHITGENSDIADEAARFASRLTKALHIETEMVDERLTTWEARRIVPRRNRRTGERPEIDDIAAAVLLRDYLEHLRETAVSTAARD